MLQVALFTCYKLQCLLVFGLYIKWALYYKGSHTKFVCQSDCPAYTWFSYLFDICFFVFLSLYLSVLLVCLFICRYLCVIHLPVCWFSTSNVQTLIPCNGVSSMLLLKPAPSELLYIRCHALEFSSIFGCLINKMYFWSPLSQLVGV